MRRLVVATGNRGKIAEMNDLLRTLGFEVLSLSDLDSVPEIIEDGTTFEENAAKKARVVCEACGVPTLADDSGLVVDALAGRPGVRSARYGGEGLTDRERYLALLEELSSVSDELRTARFECAIAYQAPGDSPMVFRGTFSGHICRTPSGDHGFGYDPVFIPDGYDITLAQIPPEEKRRISHRAQALNSFIEWIRR